MSTIRQQVLMENKVRDVASGRLYALNPSQRLGGGGEAGVYAVEGDRSKAAKIYFDPNLTRARKLEIMIANPPKNHTEKKNHNCYAWPTAAISGSTKTHVIGFLMPRIVGMKEVFNFYNPKARLELCPHF